MGVRVLSLWVGVFDPLGVVVSKSLWAAKSGWVCLTLWVGGWVSEALAEWIISLRLLGQKKKSDKVILIYHGNQPKS